MDRRDPKYTGYYPKTCSGAINLFYKKRDLDEIVWDDIDIVFRQCARDLSSSEYTKFLKWIVNPSELQGTEPCPLPADGMAHSMEEKTPEVFDPKIESCSKGTGIHCESVCSGTSPPISEAPSRPLESCPVPPPAIDP